MVLNIAQLPDASIQIQDLIVVLQFISTCLLAWLTFKTFKRDNVRVQMEMYDSIERLQMQYIEKIESRKYSFTSKLIVNIQEHLCNRYEIICYEYYKGRFNKEFFIDMYLDSIVQHVEDKNFNEFYSNSGKYNCYKYTLIVYNEGKLIRRK